MENRFFVPPEKVEELMFKLKEWKGHHSTYDPSTEILTTTASGNVTRRLYGQIFKEKIRRAE